MWIVFAIVNAILWALIIVLDRFFVKDVFRTPLQGLYITIPSALIFILMFFPLIDWSFSLVTLISFIAGFCYELSQLCYFSAMKEAKEIGNLTAIEQTYPILVTLASFLLGNAISNQQILGIFIVILATVLLQYKYEKEFSKKYIIYLGLDVLLLATFALSADYAQGLSSYFSFVGPFYLAVALTGTVPFILIKSERKEFRKIIPILKQYIPILGVIELINMVAVGSGVYALRIGHPALVTTVISTTPVFVFFFAYLVNKFTKLPIRIYPAVNNLFNKTILALFLAAGLGLLVI